MEELQIISMEKLYKNCETSVKKWEILIAKEFLRQKLKRENYD
jgi:hypothetical protein